MNERLKNNGGVSRRTIVKGAAWSVPVIVTAAAVPMVSASVNFVVSGTVTSMTTCGTGTLTILLKNAAGAPASGPVTVTLPAGLTWADGTTAPKTVMTDAAGQYSIPVKSNGQVGSQTINLQGLAPTPTDPAQAIGTVTAGTGTGGVIYVQEWSAGDPSVYAPRAADPKGMVKDPVQVSIEGGAGILQAVTANGEWWAIYANNFNITPWQKITAPPIVSLQTSSQNAGEAWGLTAAGEVYHRVSTSSTTAVLQPGVTGAIKIANISNTVFALTSGGGMYFSRPTGANPGASFSPVVVAGTSTPLTDVTFMPSAYEGLELTGYTGAIAGGVAYRIAPNSGSTPAQATAMTGPADPQEVVIYSNTMYVRDADGSLWLGGTTGSTALTKQTAVPPLTSLMLAGGGAAGVTADGRLVLWNTVSGLGLRDWTPTGFALSDVVQWKSDGGTTSNTGLEVRLANGEWWSLNALGRWSKSLLPAKVTYIDGGNQDAGAAIVNGDVACI